LYGAGVVLFFVTSRYRLPVIPVVICFAAYSVIWLKDKIVNRQWVSIKWSVPVLVAAGVFCNLPAFRLDLYLPGENEFMLGRVFYDKENYSFARMNYLEAIKKSPNNPVAINDLGNIALFENKPTEALDWYDQALRLDPFFENAHSNRGVALVKLERYAEAAEAFQKAIELAPQWDVPRKSLQNIAPYLKK
jgi:tetratricopeptide (TPR) repeat protein